MASSDALPGCCAGEPPCNNSRRDCDSGSSLGGRGNGRLSELWSLSGYLNKLESEAVSQWGTEKGP